MSYEKGAGEDMKPEDARIGQFVRVQFTGVISKITKWGLNVRIGNDEYYVPVEATEPLTQEELIPHE